MDEPQADEERDLYTKMIELQKEYDQLEMMEWLYLEEQRHLQSELIRAKQEVSQIFERLKIWLKF